MDNKAFISNQYLTQYLPQYLTTLLQDSTISSDNIFMNAIFEHALPSGFSFLTTTESGTFNPNNYCVNKSTWTYSEITVLSNGIKSNGKINFITNSATFSDNQPIYTYSGSGISPTRQSGIACGANGMLIYSSGLTTDTQKLYK